MTTHVSVREARERLEELAERVAIGGERVIVDREDAPAVALVSLDDLAFIEQARARDQDSWIRLARQAAIERPHPEVSEEELVRRVKETRKELYREWYGDP